MVGPRSNPTAVQRGDIWLVNLDPTVGSEIQKSRPCVVISPDELNDHLRTVIIAPMTSKGFAAPFRVEVVHAGTTGLVLLDQLRSVDKTRLVKKQGAVANTTLLAVLEVMQTLFTY